MIKHIKYFFQQSWLLMVSSVVFGLLLAITNAQLEPRIKQNEINKFTKLAGGMLPEARTFEIAVTNAEIDDGRGKKTKVSIQRAVGQAGKCAGWAFICEGTGFMDKIKLVITTDAEFKKLAGYGVLFSNESVGSGDKIKDDYYRSQFIGAPAVKLRLLRMGDDKKIDDEIIAISGATVSSEAVVSIINNYIGQVKTILLEQRLIDSE